MNRFGLLLAPCLLALPSLAQAQGLTITRALPSSDGVDFDTPVPLDWARLARQNFSAPSFDALDEKKLAKLCGPLDVSFGNLEFPFLAPVPRPVSRRSYSLVDENGATAFVPTQLAGTVRYEGMCLDPERVDAHVPRPYGFVSASNAALVGRGGFVLSSDAALEIRTEVLPLDRLELSGADAGRGSPLRALVRVSVKPGGRTFLLVRWGHDDDHLLCEWDYTLIEHGTAIAEGRAGCDL